MSRIEELRSSVNSKVERLNELRSSLKEYTERAGEPTADEAERFKAELSEFNELEAEHERLSVELAQLVKIAEAPERAKVPGTLTVITRDKVDPFERGREFGAPGEVRSLALRAIEEAKALEPEHRASAEKLVRQIDTPDGRLARHILITGRDDYRSAYQKLLAGRPELLLDAERMALAESRMSSLTDAQGGYAIPFTLDPTVIDTAAHAGFGHEWRRLADVTTIVTDNWNGVTSAGVTAYMTGEATEAVDGSPTLGQVSISPKKGEAFVVYTEEVYADWAQYESEIRRMFAIAKDELEDTQFTTGSGTGNNVNGIVTDLVAASTPIVASAGANTFTSPDIYAMENALAKRFRSNAEWLAGRTTYNRIRQFAATTDGADLWERIGAGMPARVLGYPINEAENMDTTFGSGENYILILGDIRQCYKIVDRVGMTIQGFPSLMGSTNNLPNGTGGLRMVWRYGAKVVNSTAAKILNVT